MRETWSVYALRDPRFGTVRYVGKTRDAEKRLRAHVEGKGKAVSEAVGAWLKELRAEGLRPMMVIVAEGLDEAAGAAKETEVIRSLRPYGNLLNATDGPAGGRRPGAGRPKGPPTRVLSVRVPAEHHAYLKAVVVALVAKLSGASPNE